MADDTKRNLVDCGECRTQGCIEGHCRQAAVTVTVTVPGQTEPIARWQRNAQGVLLQDEPGSGARALSKALAEAPGARRIVDENAEQGQERDDDAMTLRDGTVINLNSRWTLPK